MFMLKDFKPYLDLMDDGYNQRSEGVYGWYRSRTDDIMVIVEPDRVYLVCLGTEPKLREWFWNVAFRSTEWFDMGRVHRGFAKNVHELLGRQDVKDSLLNLIIESARLGKKIYFIGHSRGYPIACLSASYCIAHNVDKNLINVVGCGGARVGNKKFNRLFNGWLKGRAHVLNAKSDLVRLLPPWGYTNGQETRVSLGFLPKHLLKHYIKFVETNG